MVAAPLDDSGMQRLGEIHVQQARLHALRICAYTTAVFPREWDPQVVEDCSLQAIEFALHARRVNHICGLEDHDFGDVDKIVVKISEGGPSIWEKKYQYALNALHHSKSLSFGWAHADHRKMYANENLTPLYLRVSTDKFPEIAISLHGIANCFLTEVIGFLKVRFPSWRF